MLQFIRRNIRDLLDTIRFLPKITRRRIYYGTTALVTISTTGIYAGLQTFSIDLFVNHLQMYKQCQPIPVDPHLYDLLNETFNDERFNFKSKLPFLFNFFGCDIYSIGNLRLPTNAFIGVPFNYNFNSTDELKASDIRLLGLYKTKLTDQSPVIKRLFKSLIISDDAKRFILAHQLNLINSSYFFAKCFNILSSTLFLMWIVPRFNSKLSNLSKKKFGLLPRTLGATLCLIFVSFSSILIDQLLDYLYDIRALKQTINNDNIQYKLGAQEYYQKLIDRNCALFELLSDYGPDFYSEDGQQKKMFGLYNISYETHLAILSSKFDFK